MRAARLAGRELRRQQGRFLLIALCLAVGFAAFFATFGFARAVQTGIQRESRTLLGADLVVRHRGLGAEDLPARMTGLKGRAAQSLVIEFPTMVSGGTPEAPLTRLVEVRAVDEAYPLLPGLELEPVAARPLKGLFVDAGLAEAWGLRPALPGAEGSEALLAERRALRLGSGIVPVAGMIRQDPGATASPFALGPRVILDLATARELGLVTARARLSTRLLITLAPGTPLEPAMAEARSLAGPGVRVQGHEEAASNLARPLRNLNRFIQLLGLGTLLLAAMGGWAILTAFLEGRTREAAILRCLGASPDLPVRAYGLLAGGLLLGSLLLGYLLGGGFALLLPRLLGDLLPATLGPMGWPPPPLLETAVVLLALALLLLPPLLRLGRARPLDLLREGPEPRRSGLPFQSLAALGAALLLGVLVVRQAPNLRIGLYTALGFAGLLAVVYALSRLVLMGYLHLLPRLPLALRLGLGQLGARPGLTGLLMSVLGMAVFLTLATQFVKEDLIAPLARQRGDGSRANLFLLDVPPESRAELLKRFRALGQATWSEAPLVRARLTRIAGQPVAMRDTEQPGEEERGRSFRNREQNLSWRPRLADSERIVAGAYWPDDGRPRAEASLEEGFAQAIGARLGDELELDVAGEPIRATVTSLRAVRWTSFQLNFFILLHPSLLADAPTTHLVALEVEDSARRARIAAEVAAHHPLITVVDVADIVARVGRVLDLVALVARVLAGLMMASALLVLGASLLAGRLGRARDLALLRAVGASDALLHWSLVWEFLILGGGSAALAAVQAWLAARLYGRHVLDLEARPDPTLGLLLMAATAGLTLTLGLLASRRALQRKPLEVLRSE